MLNRLLLTLFITVEFYSLRSQEVNVFLGTSGDHGQLSPAASYPFSMLSIGPQTYPNLHAGYEHHAKLFLGFTHNRFEGVGCRGSGGNILIKPFIGDPQHCELIKTTESASPGYYSVSFTNGISAAMTVYQKAGVESYRFPVGKKGFVINLSNAFSNGFVGEQHAIIGNTISGWIESGTTCRKGIYKVYYYLSFGQHAQFTETSPHIIQANLDENDRNASIKVGLSSVSTQHAKAAITNEPFVTVKKKSSKDWAAILGQIKVSGDPNEVNLFYSLLYRTLQSPYNISEPDETFRANDGLLQRSAAVMYNGWAIWDNYRTQLPLLSLVYPKYYGDIVQSVAGLYKYGKKDWATTTEPSNTVRTEHAIVTLLDAYRKGYAIEFNSIIDSLHRENDSLDFSRPDKALESSYDTWALSQVYTLLDKKDLAEKYKIKASNYKAYWDKDFKNINAPDADQLEARGMYQGTIWQYRWLVPFDMKGLIDLCGVDNEYTKQLDQFFAKDLYNAANETDIQVPWMYNASSEPWKAQAMIRKYALDTVVQYYSDINYRGIHPQIGRVFNNRPEALLQSMDDDAGAMSGWYVVAAMGLSPACVGWPVYYLHVPLFRRISFGHFVIEVKGSGQYILSVTLNGKPFERNWITHEEIAKGGTLIITASDKLNKNFGTTNQWITDINSLNHE